jgi:hypothetical protein
MMAVYKDMVDGWNALHKQQDGNLVVGACETVQVFPQIGLDTPVGVFLTYRDNETNDVLIKVRCWGS